MLKYDTSSYGQEGSFLMLRYDPHLLDKKGLHTDVMYIWDSFMTPPVVQERAAEKLLYASL